MEIRKTNPEVSHGDESTRLALVIQDTLPAQLVCDKSTDGHWTSVNGPFGSEIPEYEPPQIHRHWGVYPYTLRFAISADAHYSKVEHPVELSPFVGISYSTEPAFRQGPIHNFHYPWINPHINRAIEIYPGDPKRSKEKLESELFDIYTRLEDAQTAPSFFKPFIQPSPSQTRNPYYYAERGSFGGWLKKIILGG